MQVFSPNDLVKAMGTHRDSFFPDPSTADPSGLVAVTPHLSTELLLDAYRHGLFPWSEHPVRWYSPDPRALFILDEIKLPRSLNRLLNRKTFRVTFDQAFEAVMRGCAEAHQSGGVWISEGFVETYAALHRMGYAHSVEVWQEQDLVGGVYGVQIKGLFAGESMFYRVSNASKVAFAFCVAQLRRLGIVLFDAQVINENTQRLGARLARRTDYLHALQYAMQMDVVDGAAWRPPPETLSSIRPPAF